MLGHMLLLDIIGNDIWDAPPKLTSLVTLEGQSQNHLLYIIIKGRVTLYVTIKHQ